MTADDWTALENDSRVRIDPHASFLTPAEPGQED